jgi:hypothetical protein
MPGEQVGAPPGRQHYRLDPPGVARHYRQHRGSASLPGAERDVCQREPQVARGELAVSSVVCKTGSPCRSGGPSPLT